MPHRVLVVDDAMFMRAMIRDILVNSGAYEVVGEAANGEEAVTLARRLAPQVVLMDLRMPVLNGVEATRRIREADPGCRVIVLTTFDDDEQVFDALRAGAVGYLLKGSPRKS